MGLANIVCGVSATSSMEATRLNNSTLSASPELKLVALTPSGRVGMRVRVCTAKSAGGAMGGERRCGRAVEPRGGADGEAEGAGTETGRRERGSCRLTAATTECGEAANWDNHADATDGRDDERDGDKETQPW